MGSLYLWLKNGVETGKLDPEMRGDCRLETKRATGQQYLYLDYYLLDASVILPSVPAEMVDRVTYRDIIYEGLRTSGVYVHEGAELSARGDLITTEMITPYQTIGIKGPSVAVVKEVFSLFRQGKLQVTESWETPQVTEIQETPQVRKSRLSCLLARLGLKRQR